MDRQGVDAVRKLGCEHLIDHAVASNSAFPKKSV